MLHSCTLMFIDHSCFKFLWLYLTEVTFISVLVFPIGKSCIQKHFCQDSLTAPHSCSRSVHRRAWISTRWSGCSVRWRSSWRARRCDSPRVSGSWSRSWRRFRTLSPSYHKRTSQLVSDKLVTTHGTTFTVIFIAMINIIVIQHGPFSTA